MTTIEDVKKGFLRLGEAMREVEGHPPRRFTKKQFCELDWDRNAVYLQVLTRGHRLNDFSVQPADSSGDASPMLLMWAACAGTAPTEVEFPCYLQDAVVSDGRLSLIPELRLDTAGTTIRPAPAKAARERIRFVSRRELEDLRGEGGRLLSFEERPAWAWDPKALLLLVEDRGGNHSKRERKRAMLPKLLQLFERLALEEPCLGLDEDSCRNCAGRGVLDGGECGRCGGSGKRGFDTCSACGGSGGGDEPELRCRRCGGSGEELPF